MTLEKTKKKTNGQSILCIFGNDFNRILEVQYECKSNNIKNELMIDDSIYHTLTRKKENMILWKGLVMEFHFVSKKKLKNNDRMNAAVGGTFYRDTKRKVSSRPKK